MGVLMCVFYVTCGPVVSWMKGWIRDELHLPQGMSGCPDVYELGFWVYNS